MELFVERSLKLLWSTESLTYVSSIVVCTLRNTKSYSMTVCFATTYYVVVFIIPLPYHKKNVDRHIF